MSAKCTRKRPCKLDECRKCLPCGTYIADVIAAYPDGLPQAQVAMLLGVSQTIVSRDERRALSAVREVLIGRDE